MHCQNYNNRNGIYITPDARTTDEVVRRLKNKTISIDDSIRNKSPSYFSYNPVYIFSDRPDNQRLPCTRSVHTSCFRCRPYYIAARTIETKRTQSILLLQVQVSPARSRGYIYIFQFFMTLEMEEMVMLTGRDRLKYGITYTAIFNQLTR